MHILISQLLVICIKISRNTLTAQCMAKHVTIAIACAYPMQW